MSLTQTYIGVLQVITCGGCGVVYGLDVEFYNKKKEDHTGFNCPNGCSRYFSGESDKDKLQREISSLQNRISIHQNIINNKNHQIQQLNYSVRAQKAAKTKILNRVKNGVCPCCNRTFKDLQNHFKTKHPELI